MSQAEDMIAVNDYFQRIPAKTPEAQQHKTAWNAWFPKLGWYDKNFNAKIWDDARARRNAFNLANAVTQAEKIQVEHVINTGITTEDLQKKPAAVIAAKREELKEKVKEINKEVIATNAPMGTIRQGASGSTVARWQSFLNTQGNSLVVDGKFGPGTAAATVKYQKANGLTADGVVGPNTWAKAFPAVNIPKPPTQAAVMTETIKQVFVPVQSAPKPTAAPKIATTAPRPAQPIPKSVPKPAAQVAPTVTNPSPVTTAIKSTATHMEAGFLTGWNKLPLWGKITAVGLGIGAVLFGIKQTKEERYRD